MPRTASARASSPKALANVAPTSENHTQRSRLFAASVVVAEMSGSIVFTIRGIAVETTLGLASVLTMSFMPRG